MAINLIQIQDRHFRATTGPWRTIGNEIVADGVTIANATNAGNAEFIAGSWRDVEVLIGELARLRQAADTALDALKLVRGQLPQIAQISVDGVIGSLEAART